MTDRLGVLSSTRFVVDHAAHVAIRDDCLARLCAKLASGDFTVPAWNKELHFHDPADGEASAMYVLLLDSLNFCFWGEPRWQVEYRGQHLDGYWALAASLRRAAEEGIPIFEARYLSQMTADGLRCILRGTHDIPLFAERLAHVTELGSGLLALYGGKASALVESAQQDAVSLVQRVVTHFPSFNDVAGYQGRCVRFFKRAQILVADLAGSFGGQGLGAFRNLEELTAFADYKLPQILRSFGILAYSEPLARKVDERSEIAAGSDEEVEIRAHTVWAVELMRRHLAERGCVALPYQIDWWLWEASQRLSSQVQPYHRTRTAFY